MRGRVQAALGIIEAVALPSNIVLVSFAARTVQETLVCSESPFREAALAYGGVALAFGLFVLLLEVAYAVLLVVSHYGTLDGGG